MKESHVYSVYPNSTADPKNRTLARVVGKSLFHLERLPHLSDWTNVRFIINKIEHGDEIEHKYKVFRTLLYCSWGSNNDEMVFGYEASKCDQFKLRLRFKDYIFQKENFLTKLAWALITASITTYFGLCASKEKERLSENEMQLMLKLPATIQTTNPIQVPESLFVYQR